MSSGLFQSNLTPCKTRLNAVNLLGHFCTAPFDNFDSANCLFELDNSLFSYQRMVRGAAVLFNFCDSIWRNSCLVQHVNLSMWLYILLDSPCVQRWHWASVWAWPWLWSGWWGSCWPGRCCNTCGQPAGRCPRGFLYAGRSPLLTEPDEEIATQGKTTGSLANLDLG